MRGPACVLSLLVPGTGQMVIGRVRRGIVFAGLAVILLPAVAVTGVWAFYAWLVLRPIAAAEVWIGPTASSRPLGAGLAGGGQVIAFLLVRVFVLESFRIRAPSMEPTLRDGEHVFLDKLSARLGSIDRGDVVVLDDPCGSGGRAVRRVVALAGDTIELRCGTVYVNGSALPQEPLGAYTYDQPGPTKTERVRAARYREAGYEVLEDEQRPGLDAARATATDYLAVADARDFPPIDGRFSTKPACGTPPPMKLERTIDRPARACDPQLHDTVPPHAIFVLGDNRIEAADSRDWGAIPLGLVRGRYVGTWWRDR